MDWLKAYAPASYLPQAITGFQNMAGAPTMERLVDESGRLGSIQDYFNPYVQQNLNPTLRAMEDAWKKANVRTGALATGGGAFGDARHGILEGENFRNYLTGTGDATYRAYFDAWNNAMGMRAGDVNRFTQQEQDYFKRQGQAGEAMLKGQALDQNTQLQLLRERLNAGGLERSVDQAGLTAAYGEWLRQQEEIQNRIKMLSAVTAAVPTDKTVKGTTNSTTTTTQPDNSWAGLAGSLLSAALAPATGGLSLAGMAGPMLGAVGSSVGPSGAPAPYAGNPYNLPWLA